MSSSSAKQSSTADLVEHFETIDLNPLTSKKTKEVTSAIKTDPDVADWEVLTTYPKTTISQDKPRVMTTSLTNTYYAEDKTWEDVKLMIRHAKSEIDDENWTLATFGCRKENHDLLTKLIAAESAIEDEIRVLGGRIMKMIDGACGELGERMKVLRERKEVLKEAKEAVDAAV